MWSKVFELSQQEHNRSSIKSTFNQYGKQGEKYI